MEHHRHSVAETDLPGTIQMFARVDGVESTSPVFSENITLIPQPTQSPNDPLNWSKPRKYWHAALVLYITALTAATSNDAGSAGDAMKYDLGISYDVQNTAAGVLFIGIGYWTLLASPMPFLYGRRIQYMICLLWSIVGSIWFARIQTVQDTVWNQLFVGASESCAEALVQLSLSDLFFQHQRGSVLGIYILATSVGTFLGPLIAGYIGSGIGWRWVGWTSVIISGVTLIVYLLTLEETSFDRDTILSGHLIPVANSHDDNSNSSNNNNVDNVDNEKGVVPDPEGSGSNGGTGNQNGPEDIPGADDQKKPYLKRIALITPAPNLIGTGFVQYFKRLFNTLRVFYFPAVIYSGLQWGAQDAWLSFYLTIEEDNWYGPPWNYGDQAVAIMNIPTLIGATIGCVYGGWFSDVFVRWMARRRGGISEAEDRLWLMFPSALINPAGLMLFGITSDKGYRWPAPYVGLGMIGFGFGCAGDLSMAYLMDAYPDMILEGMVGVAVINNTLACIFTFVTSYWIDASGVADTFIAIGVLSFFFQMLTAPMMYYGKASRRWTLNKYYNYIYIRDGR
ncbi:MFS general substrate transporter [Polychaeton citri CBS 116435]|uniref:MFS general substrate transporter n=1 Tax=Polychaeton citri CBS 116435 TaxID=1314669 RepID=A0A9P4UNP4_9PEZI|nr:MFS general substrate transporter [Polychaeton citri CBS 116435]